MLVSQVNSSTGKTQIIVKGNRSVTWRANVLLASAVGCASLFFGIGIAFFGYWLVLPFAGLEFVFVLVCLGKTYRRLGYMEVISIGDNTVVIESGHEKPDKTVELIRAWTQVRFEDPPSCFDVGKLVLQSTGQSYEIGSCLAKEEKRKLYREMVAGLQADEPRLRLIS